MAQPNHHKVANARRGPYFPKSALFTPHPFYIKCSTGEIIAISGKILTESALIKRHSNLFNCEDTIINYQQLVGHPGDPCGTSKNPLNLPTLHPIILEVIGQWIDNHASKYKKWGEFNMKCLRKDPERCVELLGLEEETLKFFNNEHFFDLFATAEFLEMRSLTVACMKYSLIMLTKQTADELRRRYKLKPFISIAAEEEIGDRVLRLQVMLPIEQDFKRKQPDSSDDSDQDETLEAPEI